MTNLDPANLPAIPSSMYSADGSLVAPTKQFGSISLEWTTSADSYPMDPKKTSEKIADQDFTALTGDSSA